MALDEAVAPFVLGMIFAVPYSWVSRPNNTANIRCILLSKPSIQLHHSSQSDSTDSVTATQHSGYAALPLASPPAIFSTAPVGPDDLPNSGRESSPIPIDAKPPKLQLQGLYRQCYPLTDLQTRVIDSLKPKPFSMFGISHPKEPSYISSSRQIFCLARSRISLRLPTQTPHDDLKTKLVGQASPIAIQTTLTLQDEPLN